MSKSSKSSGRRVLSRSVALTLLFLWLPALMCAETKEYLVVHLNNGSDVNYVLEETPIVTFTPTSLHVESTTMSDDHTLSDVSHFTFDEFDVSALPILKTDDMRIMVTENQVALEGFTPDASVTLADAQGRVYAGGKIDGNRSFALDIREIPAGIYIITISDSKSFKIIKK